MNIRKTGYLKWLRVPTGDAVLSGELLAPHAAHEGSSKGRCYDEPTSSYRGEYQRDRDRIIHSTAFRRLMYKTQVFVNHEGDLYRTRLTHSLEVAQIGRTVARAMRLNESLVEAISLAHDLGHTPFGHSGQDALNQCMREYGGFEHNLQSLRVVDELEEKYADFPGLNLTWETREGILKHCSVRNARELGALGKRFLDRKSPGLEAQIVDMADSIAYNNHDVDDGVRAGLIGLSQLQEQRMFRQHFEIVKKKYAGLEDRRLIYEVIRRMINYVVTDLIDHTSAEVKALNPTCIDDIRNHKKSIAGFSADVLDLHQGLKRFLHKNLYQHEQVRAMNERTKEIIGFLFERYMADPALMPIGFAKSDRSDDTIKARVVANYIAGMTDRFAIVEHERLN